MAAKGLAASREQAQKLIMAGRVYVDEDNWLRAGIDGDALIVTGRRDDHERRGGGPAGGTGRHRLCLGTPPALSG